MERGAALGWYVYGVVESGAEPPSVAGVGGAVEVADVGAVSALVSRVDLAEFGEEPARENLEDSGWLERHARAHETVLREALHSGAGVVPFRFLTVYRDEAELRRFLDEHESQLAAVLERVRGTAELGVKAFVDRDALDRSLAARSDAVADIEDSIAGAGTGRAYLLERRREQLARDEASRILATLAADAHERLRAAALAGVANAVQPPELSGRADQMLLNGAYLVPAGDGGLPAVVRELEREGADLGVAFELTGPWPPYNFVPRDLGT